MLASSRRRFYQQAAIAAAEDGFTVTLDGKPIKTPAGNFLRLVNATLAEKIAAEWNAQDAEINPQHMPFFQLACTAQDRVKPDRAAIVMEIAKYLGSDLLCYLAPEPPELVTAQRQSWTPIRNQLEQHFGIKLVVTAGINPVAQDASSIASLVAAIEQLDDSRLTAISVVTAAAGSALLGLALLHELVTVEAVIHAAQLDETIQAERWGMDSETSKRLAGLAADIRHADAFWRLANS